MASVSSAGDSTYSYYQKALNDLTEENRRDRKRAQESEKERVSELSENSAAERRDTQEEHEETIKKIKEDYNTAFKIERDQNKEDRENLRKSLTYDSAGRLQTDEVRIQNKRLQEEHEKELKHLRKGFHESDQALRERSTENLKELKGEFAEKSGELSKTNDERIADLKRQNTEIEKILSTQNKKDKEQADIHLNSVVERESQTRKEALAAQSKAYQSTMERNRTDHNDQIKQLKKEVMGDTTGNTSRPLPAQAYNKVRDGFLKEYNQKMEARDAQHETHLNGVENHAIQMKEEAIADSRNREFKRHQAALAEQLRDRNAFKYQTELVIDSTNHQLREQDESFRRSTLKQDQTRERDNAEMKRRFDETIDATRLDAQIRINALKQENDIQTRAMQREANTRYSEAVRSYEKKLTEQKNQYESLMQEHKSQLDATLRETEKHHRAELETQNRLAAARLAENESIARERERAVAVQHQEELEKVRNFHAQQLKKKS